MFSLHRRQWFAGLSALLASVALDRHGANAAPETPAMSARRITFPNATADDLAEGDLLDITWDISEPAWRGRSLWAPALDDTSEIADAALAEEWVKVIKALEHLIDLAPEALASDGLVPTTQLHEAIQTLFGMGWHTAIHTGYALAMRNAPVVLTVEASLCGACWGAGRLWNGEPHWKRPAGAGAAAATVCETCAGKGVIDEAEAVAFHPHRRASLPAWVPDPKGMRAKDWRSAFHEAEIQHTLHVLGARDAETNAA